MITPMTMNIVHNAIEIYDPLCNKNYLLVFGSRGSNKYYHVQLTIKESSFWHLVGCELEPNSDLDKHNTYIKCKNKQDVSDKLVSIHGLSEIQDKYDAMCNVFNFIKKVKQIKVGYSGNCPEKYLFKVGAGNSIGIIGYDYPNLGPKTFLLPKSAQKKSLSKITKDPYRIFAILSKQIDDLSYTVLEYEIKPGVWAQLIEHIPDTISLSPKLKK